MGTRELMSQTFTPDEKVALDQAKKRRKKIDGWYEIGIPWRQGEPSSDNNYEMALSRVKVQEESLMKKGLKLHKLSQGLRDEGVRHKSTKDRRKPLVPPSLSSSKRRQYDN